MSEVLGYNSTLEDSEGNKVYPTGMIDNIMNIDGSKDSVSKGIIWPSEFIVIEESKICIIHVKSYNPVNITIIPTIPYDHDYAYYVNSNRVRLRTNTDDPYVGLEWEVGVPIQGTLKDGILYIPTSKNDKGLFINNNPVEIDDISDGDLLQYKDGKIIKYTPPVLPLYTPGQIKGWTFSSHGSEIATYPSACEGSNLRVCVYGNGDIIRGTAIAESEVYDFSNYTNIVIKYTNGTEEFSPVVQIISEDNSHVVYLPFTDEIDTISHDISSLGFKKAKVQISVTASESHIHEIVIFDIKLA